MAAVPVNAEEDATTNTVIGLALLQPLSVQVAVYVVVVLGVTTKLLPVAPVFQLKVPVQLEVDRVTLVPGHTVAEVEAESVKFKVQVDKEKSSFKLFLISSIELKGTKSVAKWVSPNNVLN